MTTPTPPATRRRGGPRGARHQGLRLGRHRGARPRRRHRRLRRPASSPRSWARPGSGKSTLMHCVAGLDSLTSGQVFIGDTDLTTLERQGPHPAAPRPGRLRVPAFNLIPTLTAQENITLPLDLAGRKPDQEWLDKVVATVGLGDRLKHRPERAVRRPAAARRGGPRPRGAARRSSSPTSPPATSTRAPAPRSSASCSDAVERPRPDDRDGHPRPGRRRLRRPRACSSPTAASSTSCTTRRPSRSSTA